MLERIKKNEEKTELIDNIWHKWSGKKRNEETRWAIQKKTEYMCLEFNIIEAHNEQIEFGKYKNLGKMTPFFAKYNVMN